MGRSRRIVLSLAVLPFIIAMGCGPDVNRDPNSPQRQSGPNPSSIGFIDKPHEGDTVDTPLEVAGWALDESGVKAVRIYFDDDLVATLPVVVPRPDIIKRYPAYANQGPVHGFMQTIDAGAHAGYTVIRAVAIDGRGAQTDVYHITVRIRE
jgi:hypothetical protein